jgi:hypothetical protein
MMPCDALPSPPFLVGRPDWRVARKRETVGVFQTSFVACIFAGSASLCSAKLCNPLQYHALVESRKPARHCCTSRRVS